MAGEGSSGGGRSTDPLEGVRAIVLKPSESLDESRFTRIAGADFNDAGLGLDGLLGSLASTGFQASHLGDAIDVVNQMVRAPPAFPFLSSVATDFLLSVGLVRVCKCTFSLQA
jgi:deoxyhypusine synthase